MSDETFGRDGDGGGWPIWGKCVICYDKTFGGGGGGIEESTKAIELYGDRDFFFLPCTHLVCSEECLGACRRPGLGTGEEGPTMKDSYCPSCKTKFCVATIAATNTIRPLEVIGRVPQQTVRLKKKCQGCIRKDVFSIKYCEDCSQALCKFCTNQHTYMIDTAQHSVIDSLHVYDIVPKSSICKEHPSQNLKTFCNDCDLQLCDMCVSGGVHTLHDTCNLKEFAQKTVESFKAVCTEHSKIVSACKAYHGNLLQQIQEIDEHAKRMKPDSDWALALDKIASVLGQQEVDLREDIICEVVRNVYAMNLQNTGYKSLFSQAEVFRSFCKTFELGDLLQNKNKCQLLTRFYNLMKEHVKYTKKTRTELSQEQPVGNVTLVDNTSETWKAIEKVWLIVERELPSSSNSNVVPPPDIAGVDDSQPASQPLPVNASQCSNLLPLDALQASTSTSSLPNPNPQSTITSPPLLPSTPLVLSSFTDQIVNEMHVGSTIAGTPTESRSTKSLLLMPTPSLPSLETTIEDIDVVTLPSTSNSQHVLINPASPNLPTATTSIHGSAYCNTILDPESDNTSNDDNQRVAFMCDFEDSSDEERVRIKNEPMDYDDEERDEAPPDDDEDTRDVPCMVIKKEINNDSFCGQDYGGEMNGMSSELQNDHASLAPDTFFFQSGSNTASKDEERNVMHNIASTHRTPTIQVLEPGSNASTQMEEYIGIDTIEKSPGSETRNERLIGNIPQALTHDSRTMISPQSEMDSKAQYFDGEYILPNAPSPLSDNLASEDDYFNIVLPDTINEQSEETEPEEVLDPQTGLLIPINNGCRVDAEISNSQQGENPIEPQIPVRKTPDLDNRLINENQNVQIPTLSNAQEDSRDNDPKMASPTDPLVEKILPVVTVTSSPSSKQVNQVSDTESPSSPFSVPSLKLTPTLIKFAHSRGHENQQLTPETPKTHFPSRTVKKGKSVEIQTVAETNIVKKEPEPYHQHESHSAELSTISPVTILPATVEIHNTSQKFVTASQTIPKRPNICTTTTAGTGPINIRSAAPGQKASVLVRKQPPCPSVGMPTRCPDLDAPIVDPLIPSQHDLNAITRQMMPLSGVETDNGETWGPPPVLTRMMPTLTPPRQQQNKAQSLSDRNEVPKECKRGRSEVFEKEGNHKDYMPNLKKPRVETSDLETKRSQRERKQVVHPGYVNSDEAIKSLNKDKSRFVSTPHAERRRSVPQATETRSAPTAKDGRRPLKSDRISAKPRISLEPDADAELGVIHKPIRTYAKNNAKTLKCDATETCGTSTLKAVVRKESANEKDGQAAPHALKFDGREHCPSKTCKMSDPVEANDEAPMGIEATTIFDTTGQKDLSQKVQENIVVTPPNSENESQKLVGVEQPDPLLNQDASHTNATQPPSNESVDKPSNPAVFPDVDGIPPFQPQLQIRSISDESNKSVPPKKRRRPSHDKMVGSPTLGSDARKIHDLGISSETTSTVSNNTAKPHLPKPQSPNVDTNTNRRKSSSDQTPSTSILNKPSSTVLESCVSEELCPITPTSMDKIASKPQTHVSQIDGKVICATGRSKNHSNITSSEPATTNLNGNNEKQFPEMPQKIKSKASNLTTKSLGLNGTELSGYGAYGVVQNSEEKAAETPAPRKRGGRTSKSKPPTKPPTKPKKPRGRPVGWRKKKGESSCSATPKNSDHNCKRTRRSRQSSPVSPQESPVTKITIKTETERPDDEDGDFYNSEDEVAPETSPSPTSFGRRLSSQSNSDGDDQIERPLSFLRSTSRGSSQSPVSVYRPRKRNRSDSGKSSRWSARLVRSQSMESTSSRVQSSQSKKTGDKDTLGKTGVGPKLILTRSKTPTTPRPETPSSIRLSVDSV